MDAGGFHLEIEVGDDAVERQHRAAGVKARAGGDDVVGFGEMRERAAFGGPLVEVAHDHGRQLFLERFEHLQHRERLPLAPQADEAEVHADDPDDEAVDLDVGHHGAARLELRQVNLLVQQDLSALAHEDRVAVPAEAGGAGAEADRDIVGRLGDVFDRERRGAAAEAAVNLLQRNDICVDFAR